ncbi:MAG: hypothetical protein QQW96_20625 [Tychonema bourrellyi B0820]|uniref:DUF433 domain-containing protein n=1 Tax=Tychonema bourrellyi TaxID=54313 RepID=UPI001FE9DABF|nr:hypothetical protein [Tychonema bourrellyi]MDQ2100041.1 hypothetical protein [Tychonema bourrellyi B0820]
MVIRAFQDGASPESIVQRYSTVSLSDVYSAIGYYLRHQETVEAYLNYREQLADSVRQRLWDIQPDLTVVRSRLLAPKNLEG